MSKETETRLDDESRRAVAADNADKTDLSNTGDAVLDDGKSDVPIKNDPFDSRKAIFGKSTSARARRMEAEAAEHADVAALQDAQAEASSAPGSRDELDRGSHFDTNAERANEEQRRAAVEAARQPAQAEADQRVNAPAKDYSVNENGRVTVRVLGREIEVPPADIEAAGSLKAYQLERAAYEQMQQNARDRKKLDEDRQALIKQQQEAEQQRASASPAGKTGDTSTHQGEAGTDADDDKIIADLYSGDPKRAQAAVKALRGNTQKSPALDTDAIARQVAEVLRLQGAVPAAPAQPAAAQPQVDPDVEDLNRYMRENHNDILVDTDLRTRTLKEYERLRTLPENRDRRLRDIGREAAESVKKPPHPRQDVIDRKQTLPPVTSGSATHSSAPSAPAPLTGSSVVERMRRHNGLPT